MQFTEIDSIRQNDFIKNFNVFDDNIIGYTENNKIQIYHFINEKLQKTFQISQPNPIYDLQQILTGQEQDEQQQYNIFSLSQKNIPIQFYKINFSNNKLISVGAVNDHISGTEKFYSPLCMKHDENNGLLHCGGKNFLFNINLHTLKKQKDIKCVKKQIISCIDINDKYLVAGSFDKTVKLIDFENEIKFAELKAHVGGVTFVKQFEQNIFSAARYDDLVYQWDIRKTNQFINYFQRNCSTNQRMSFDLYNNLLFLGNQNGSCNIYDIQSNQQIDQFQAHQNCLNSLRIYQDKLITSSGERHFNIINNEQSSQDSLEEKIEIDNSFKIWKF